MQKVTVLFPCQPGKGKEMLEILTAALVETRAYDGCHGVETFVDEDDPDAVLLVEEWETRGHHERYMTWRTENGMGELLQPILAKPLDVHYLDARPI
ncbi:MAG TPA: antibiotic biosynthesis monooxygenase family protein [Acidimicrobiales bacterium]|nr:antibiotic biosynthesis monooxygenase family protein [Acidimicrobiales bacterium]